MRTSLLMLLLFASGALARPVNFYQDQVVQKLRTFCTACHGLGELRFLHSDDNADVWEYINTQKAPRSQKLWTSAIREVLTWPSSQPPTMPISPTKDWMPKGYKRLELADDEIGELSTREFILSVLPTEEKECHPN